MKFKEKKELCVIAPALADVAAKLLPKNLNRLLSRGSLYPVAQHDTIDILFTLFQQEKQVGKDWPSAALSLYGDSFTTAHRWWFHADPVHLAVTRDHVMILGDKDFTVSIEEAQELTVLLTRHFANEDWQFVFKHPNQWYLGIKEDPEIATTPLPQAMERDLQPCMPTGSHARQWRTIINEIQMVLFNSPVNQRREKQGQLPINSLWLWGGGFVPVVKPSPWEKVWGDNRLLTGLARLSAITQSPLDVIESDGLMAELFDFGEFGNYLLLLDTPVQGGGGLNNALWGAFIKKLKSDSIGKMSIFLVNGTKVVITKNHLNPLRRVLTCFSNERDITRLHQK